MAGYGAIRFHCAKTGLTSMIFIPKILPIAILSDRVTDIYFKVSCLAYRDIHPLTMPTDTVTLMTS